MYMCVCVWRKEDETGRKSEGMCFNGVGEIQFVIGMQIGLPSIFIETTCILL